jgi:hypothetical protein
VVVKEWEDVGQRAEEVKVWKARTEGWEDTVTGYLSVNATTLDQRQEGLDLRKWHERGWICYMDCKDEAGYERFREPYEGSMY